MPKSRRVYKLNVIFKNGKRACYPHIYDFNEERDKIKFKFVIDRWGEEWYILRRDIKDFKLSLSKRGRG